MDSIIIIGGGAAGLMVAYELSKHKKQVIVLEAKNRLGGRIHTLVDNSFSQAVELGAEFIHGDLPYTLSILQKAGIQYYPGSGKMYRVEQGKFKKQNDFSEDWSELMKRMHELKKDMPLADFLHTFFSDDKYAALRASVKGFAGGFDLADISTASTKALYREWNEEWGDQYRIEGGYKRLIDYLEIQCKNSGCLIETNCCVKKINWQKNEVNMLTMCSRFFKSNKVIITVPLSVLQAGNNDENYMEFVPAIPQHISAAKNIGFGAVIKIILEFSESFWNTKKKDAGFILTGEEVPTWWKQLPVDNTILTGWTGGEKAIALKEKTDEEILNIALQSLSNAFTIPLKDLKLKLKTSQIANWCKEPDISGGYSFDTTGSTEARKILRRSIDDTIFFAGEGLYEGTPGGTVEAALHNGRETAVQVLETGNK